MPTARERMLARQKALKGKQDPPKPKESEEDKKKKAEEKKRKAEAAKKKREEKKRLEAEKKKEENNKYKILEDRLADLTAMFTNYQQQTAEQLAALKNNESKPEQVKLPYTKSELETFLISFDYIFKSERKRAKGNGSTGRLAHIDVIEKFVKKL